MIKSDSYVWLNDWYEGQTDIEVLGYMLLGDVDTTKLEPCEDWKFYYKHGYAQARNDVLDKIRAEIEKKVIKRPWLDFEDRERDRNDAFLEVLDIIDKYKAESEE